MRLEHPQRIEGEGIQGVVLGIANLEFEIGNVPQTGLETGRRLPDAAGRVGRSIETRDRSARSNAMQPESDQRVREGIHEHGDRRRDVADGASAAWRIFDVDAGVRNYRRQFYAKMPTAVLALLAEELAQIQVLILLYQCGYVEVSRDAGF